MEPDRDITDRVSEISEHTGPPRPEPVPDDSGLPTRQSLICLQSAFYTDMAAFRMAVFFLSDRGRSIHWPRQAQKADDFAQRCLRRPARYTAAIYAWIGAVGFRWV